MNKIEQNLDPEITANEQKNKEHQITLAKYHQVAGDVINPDEMKGFSLFTERDSKWLVDENTYSMGRRIEWKNEMGAIIGINVSDFVSNDAARSSSEIHSSPGKYGSVYKPFIAVDDVSTLDTIIEDWTTKVEIIESCNIANGRFRKNIISGIMTKGNTAIHVYHYDPEMADTELFKSIAVQLANKLSF